MALRDLLQALVWQPKHVWRALPGVFLLRHVLLATLTCKMYLAATMFYVVVYLYSWEFDFLSIDTRTKDNWWCTKDNFRFIAFGTKAVRDYHSPCHELLQSNASTILA